MSLWVWLALAAGTLQTARNALSRSLVQELSPLWISWSRFAFNLPLCGTAVLVLAAVDGLPHFGGEMLAWCLLTAVVQLLGNICLVSAFRVASFAHAIVLHKLEVVMAAAVGWLWFAEVPSTTGWFGVALCSLGAVVAQRARSRPPQVPGRERSAKRLRTAWGSVLSLASGLLLVIAGFSLKESTRAFLVDNPSAAADVRTAMWILFHTVWMEVVLLSIAVSLSSNRRQVKRRQVPRMMAIGLFGFLASTCWFWAYPLALVSYVKGVGQSEAVWSILLSLLVFREPGVARQLPGLLLLMVGILLVVLG